MIKISCSSCAVCSSWKLSVDSIYPQTMSLGFSMIVQTIFHVIAYPLFYLRYHMHSLTLHLSPFLLCSGCSSPANTGPHPAGFSSSLHFWKRSSCIHPQNLPVSNKTIHNLLNSVTFPSIGIPIMLLFHLPCMPKTISTDNRNLLAGVRHMQISLGLPAPNEISSFPQLQKVQLGIQHLQEITQRTLVPITTHILGQLREHWFQDSNNNEDMLMLWAAATLCYLVVSGLARTQYHPKQYFSLQSIQSGET